VLEFTILAFITHTPFEVPTGAFLLARGESPELVMISAIRSMRPMMTMPMPMMERARMATRAIDRILFPV
jgi:hypothetical protein